MKKLLVIALAGMLVGCADDQAVHIRSEALGVPITYQDADGKLKPLESLDDRNNQQAQSGQANQTKKNGWSFGGIHFHFGENHE